MDHLLLQEATDRWLRDGTARFLPVFPPMLEALFVTENAPAKTRAMRLSTAIASATGLAIVPALWLLMPDTRGLILHMWLGLAIPASLFCHALLWLRLPPTWLERLCILCAVLVALCYAAMMVHTRQNVETCFFGGLLLLMLVGVIAGGTSVPLASLYAASLLTIVTIGTQFVAGAAGLHGLVSSLLYAVCCVFGVIGAWRLETEMRRSWALMLRERLKGMQLADHNTELAALAQRDPLTNLANRRSYESGALSLWRRAEQAGTKLGLIVVDIDCFKKYNDFYGHPAGDACLQAVSRCLAEQLRGSDDLVARVGGEEFAILLPDLSVETAGDIAERVRQAVQALELPHLGWGAGCVVTISCGACSMVPCGNTSSQDLFAAADAALYAAKQAGRNRVCLADTVPAAVPIRDVAV